MLLRPFDNHVAKFAIIADGQATLVDTFADLVDCVTSLKSNGVIRFEHEYFGDNHAFSIWPGITSDQLAKFVQSTIVSRCMNGDCWNFALLAAERIESDGFAFACSDDEEVVTHHVGLKLKDGRVLDVTGMDALERHEDNAQIREHQAEDLVRRWRHEGDFPATMDPRDDFRFNGRVRFAIDAIAHLERLELAPRSHRAAINPLIIVHPGSMCGSADSNIGKAAAGAGRQGVVSDLEGWAGDIAILDNFLSDELPGTSLWKAITTAFARTDSQYLALRSFGCDNMEPAIASGVDNIIIGLGLSSGDAVSLTGAWYDEADMSGCVNEVRRLLAARGINAIVLDSAISLDDAPEAYDDLEDCDLSQRP